MKNILMVGGVFSGIFDSFKKNKRKDDKSWAKKYYQDRQQNKFHINVFEEKEVRDLQGVDTPISFLTIQIQGIVNTPRDNYPTKFKMKLRDVTEIISRTVHEPRVPSHTVFSNNEQFQNQTSKEFHYEETVMMPYSRTLFKEWTTQVKIPLLFLDFINKGERRLDVELFVIDQDNKILEKYGVLAKILNENDGYEDRTKKRYKFIEVAVNTAMLISVVDGAMDENETDIVKRWVKIITPENHRYKDDELRDLFKRIFIKKMNSHIELMAAFFQHGMFEWRGNGLAVKKDPAGGFMTWYASLGNDGPKFLQWVTAKRVTEMAKEERESYMTEEMRKKIFAATWAMDDARALELNRQFQEFNNNILDIAQEAGIINAEGRAQWQQEFYIPFYRMINEEENLNEDLILAAPSKIRRHVTSGIKRLKGGESKLGNPVENIIQNWAHLINESMRNQSRSHAFEAGKLKGMARRVPKSFLKMTDRKTLSFLRDGETIYFQVSDDGLFNALRVANKEYGQLTNNETDIYDVLSNIDEIATESEKYELFELCLKVASVDSIAAAGELKILNEISEALRLDRAKIQLMIEKELPITIHAESMDNKESMVGITPDMDNEQIKKHLRKEYTKWNSRVTNRNPAIREQAEEMIRIISELRKKHS